MVALFDAPAIADDHFFYYLVGPSSSGAVYRQEPTTTSISLDSSPDSKPVRSPAAQPNVLHGAV